MIFFPEPKLRKQWESGNLDPRLESMVMICEALWSRDMPPRAVVVTSIQRPKTTDSGVHADWRGVDIRTRDIPNSMVDEAAQKINRTFVYGGGFNAALVHDVGYGIHLHLQVPPPRIAADEFVGYNLRGHE